MLPHTAIESTKLYYGEEAAMKILMQAMANVKKEAVVCSDSNSPIFSMTVEPVKKGYMDFKKRNIHIRQIVEITHGNLQHCKEFKNYVELRHMDNVKGNMAVSETEYVATSALKGSISVTQTIYSNVKAFLEQQRYFFENLWSKAIPAEQRIKEIEEAMPPQRTETVYGKGNTIQAILKFISETTHEFCVYAESSYAQATMSSESVVRAYTHFKNTRKGKARWITEVNLSNIESIRKLMQFAEVRHLDSIRGNAVAINEITCLTTINLKIGKSDTPYAIANTIREIVEQQKFTFETLWSKAAPAEHRIREIVQRIEPQRIDVVYDAGQALEIYQSLIMSAKKEIKIVFPTTNAVIRQDKAGILFLLQEAAKNCQVKLLMPFNEIILNFVPTNIASITTRFIEQQGGGKATILIVDDKASLMMELKDDRKRTFQEAIGLSTHSNSKAGVLSYVSMFESLWKQTQLNEELKRNEKMQKEFINIAAHELRTPVQPILGMAELLELGFEGGKTKTEISKEELDIIFRNAKRLERLSSDVLETARIESHSMRLNKELFSLNEVISNLIRDAVNQIDNQHITIRYDPKDIVVYADKGRISEVISNILDNAIKFTQDGNIIISTEINSENAACSNDEAIILIRDEGTGIDSQIASRLFTKFATKSDKGTGLGLYISKSIIEAHGGRIWAGNNEDKIGATFGFSIPLK
ncbi:MAG: HAMP domain-containing histidine kinase [Thermoproteota archaeon]|nr:HAMP domain-containing histidine kinase [Thermoproteota archaeon]